MDVNIHLNVRRRTWNKFSGFIPATLSTLTNAKEGRLIEFHVRRFSKIGNEKKAGENFNPLLHEPATGLAMLLIRFRRVRDLAFVKTETEGRVKWKEFPNKRIKRSGIITTRRKESNEGTKRKVKLQQWGIYVLIFKEERSKFKNRTSANLMLNGGSYNKSTVHSSLDVHLFNTV